MPIGNWGYPNGQIPASAMEEAGGVLWKPSVARQVRAWIAACARRGVELVFDEGYRNLERQRFWKDYWTAHGLPGNAATIGESSHGLGQAGDLNLERYSAEEEAVIVEEGARFGMLRNYMPAEPWHFADVGTVTASLEIPTTITIKQEELPMLVNYVQITDGANAGRIYAIDAVTGKVRHINVYEARAIAANRGLSLSDWAIKYAEDINAAEEAILVQAGYIK